MEEENGGYVPMEHREVDKIQNLGEAIREEEVKESDELYQGTDPSWAKAPNGLIFGILPKDIVDAT